MKTKKAPAPLEKEIEKSILEYLEHLPECYAWKNVTGGFFNTKTKTFRKQTNKFAINGTSDILGIYKGKFLAIEVKRPSNKVRPQEQLNFINQINIMGGKAFFATSIDDVREALK
jgi:penicillin-binding protein-related factor A (putative recombinase)